MTQSSKENRDIDLKKYVFHSLNILSGGCCVLVGNHIITSGHVVGEHHLSLSINGNIENFDKENASVYEWDKGEIDGSSSDIAIFRVDSMSSPIEFDCSDVEKGMRLRSISYEHVVEQSDKPDLLFGGNLYTEFFRLIDCNAVVTAVEGNFFQCETEIELHPGSSGSPIFNGTKLIGILHGGQQGTRKCLFQASKSFADLLLPHL